MTIDEIMKSVENLCQKYHAAELILYGSRAKGTATDRSDFDFAVSGVSDFDALQEAIDDLPTLYSFDLINMDTS